MAPTGTRHGFNAQAVMQLAGLTHRKLVYLDKTGLVRPSVRPATGSGSRRVYSFQDLVGLRVLADMRRAGLSLQAVRGVVEHMRAHRKQLASLQITLQGRRVFIRTDNPRTLEELTAGGQLTMVLPVGEIVRQLGERLTQIRAPRPFTVCVGGHSYHCVATPDLEVGGFSIEIPALPGCFSEADTMREARAEAREAIEAHLGVEAVPSAPSKRAVR